MTETIETTDKLAVLKARREKAMATERNARSKRRLLDAEILVLEARARAAEAEARAEAAEARAMEVETKVLQFAVLTKENALKLDETSRVVVAQAAEIAELKRMLPKVPAGISHVVQAPVAPGGTRDRSGRASPPTTKKAASG